MSKSQTDRPVSEMTYTVSSGTLNSTIPYHTKLTDVAGTTASHGVLVEERLTEHHYCYMERIM